MSTINQGANAPLMNNGGWRLANNLASFDNAETVNWSRNGDEAEILESSAELGKDRVVVARLRRPHETGVSILFHGRYPLVLKDPRYKARIEESEKDTFIDICDQTSSSPTGEVIMRYGPLTLMGQADIDNRIRFYSEYFVPASASDLSARMAGKAEVIQLMRTALYGTEDDSRDAIQVLIDLYPSENALQALIHLSIESSQIERFVWETIINGTKHEYGPIYEALVWNASNHFNPEIRWHSFGLIVKFFGADALKGKYSELPNGLLNYMPGEDNPKLMVNFLGYMALLIIDGYNLAIQDMFYLAHHTENPELRLAVIVHLTSAIVRYLEDNVRKGDITSSHIQILKIMAQNTDDLAIRGHISDFLEHIGEVEIPT